MELQYAGYTILALLALGFLISLIPIKEAGKDEGESKEPTKNDPRV